MEQKAILANMLKRVFKPFDPLRLTTPLTSNRDGRNEVDQIALWTAQRQDTQLAIFLPAVMFDGFGLTGVWDRIHAVLGAKAVTINNAIPWVVITRAKLGVAIWPSGKVQLQVSKACLTVVEAMESIILNHFAGRWLLKSEWETRAAESPSIVSYGVAGEIAKQHQGMLFP